MASRWSTALSGSGAPASRCAWASRTNHTKLMKSVAMPWATARMPSALTAEVLGVDAELRGQAVLSLIALQVNPWLAWVDRVGSVLTGPVTKVVPFGVFVGVGGGMSGLIHNSELPCPCFHFAVGDEITVRIAEVEPVRRRMRLMLASSDKRSNDAGNLERFSR